MTIPLHVKKRNKTVRSGQKMGSGCRPQDGRGSEVCFGGGAYEVVCVGRGWGRGEGVGEADGEGSGGAEEEGCVGIGEHEVWVGSEAVDGRGRGVRCIGC